MIKLHYTTIEKEYKHGDVPRFMFRLLSFEELKSPKGVDDKN